MPEYRYEWEVILQGFGSDQESAWQSMIDDLDSSDWTMPPTFITREIVEADHVTEQQKEDAAS
jgi:hypothetical protein